MTKEQARQIGRLIATARHKRGWSLRRLALETDISHPALFKIERGEYTGLSSDWLIRLADALSIDTERFNRITNIQIAKNLPSVRTYFRAKYALNPDEIEELERTIEDIRRKHERRDKDE